MLPGIHIDSIQEVVRGSSGVSPSKRNCLNINTLGIWKNDPLCPGKSTPIPFRGRYCGVFCGAESISRPFSPQEQTEFAAPLIPAHCKVPPTVAQVATKGVLICFRAFANSRADWI